MVIAKIANPALALCILSLAACGGGSGSGSTPPARFTTQRLNATFRAVIGVAAGRVAQRTAPGDPVTLSANGSVIASGTLDAARHVTLVFSSVAGGTRVKLSGPTISPTIVLARTTAGTIAQVTEQSNGTLAVTATNDVDESGTVNDNDGENQENDIEDQNGQVGQSPSPSPSPSPSSTPK